MGSTPVWASLGNMVVTVTNRILKECLMAWENIQDMLRSKNQITKQCGWCDSSLKETGIGAKSEQWLSLGDGTTGHFYFLLYASLHFPTSSQQACYQFCN